MHKLLGLFLAVAICSAGCVRPVSAADVGWPSYNGSLESHRFSPLTDITPQNAADLREVCEASLGDEGAVEAAPVVIGDTLYVTTIHTVVAIDATNCALRWRYIYEASEQEIFPVNRGVAYLDGKLYRGTNDGRLVAINATTGKELWRVKIADPTIGEFLAAAPIVWNGMIFLGPAGSDWGIHGRMNAYDAKTGKEVWRFNLIPNKGEPGYETWHIPETAIHGGGGTWTSYTLDPATGELFVSIANPAPDLLPDTRPGDNLYTNAVVVLDAKTGTLKWYYQFDPNDGFDYDLSATAALFTDNRGHRRLAVAGKDGYLYLVDRDTHKLVSKTAITTQKPPPSAPTPAGVYACPGSQGGVLWNGPAYSPATNLVYTGAVDWCATFQSGPAVLQPPRFYSGTGIKHPLEKSKTGWVYGVNAATGKAAWQYHASSPVVSGTTPTAGGVLLSGEASGDMLVFDARSGKLLLKQNLGGSLGSSFSTYSVAGKQYVATMAGNASRSNVASGNGFMPRVIVLTTGLDPAHQPVKVAVAPPGEGFRFGVEPGATAYAIFRSACHGFAGEGGADGPPLLNESSRKGFDEIVAVINNPKPPMPKLSPPMTQTEVESVARHIQKFK
jgi:alcohol dehydrogenase (cytochrome c)